MWKRAHVATFGVALCITSNAFAATSGTPTAPTAVSTAATRNEDINDLLYVPRYGISFLIQNDTAILRGTAVPEDGLLTNTLSLQPLIPLPLGPMALYLRPFLPLRYLPVPAPELGDDYAFGLGDAGLLAAVVPFPRWPILAAVGPVMLFPTATNKQLSQEHFQLGPAFGAFYTTSPWFVGFLAQPLWSIGGSAPPVAQLDVQYYILRTLPDNWQIGTSPDIFIDWKAEKQDRLTLPVGLGLWKAFRVGKLPMRVGMELQYSIVRPETVGEQWNLRVQVTPHIVYPGAGEPSSSPYSGNH